jgi:2,3-bisphosphoglycerate-independent phosphoglycerate mutase
MKYVMLVGDGMGDYPMAELGGKTVLAAAHTPHMDWIADHGESGLATTIPQGCETGSEDPARTFGGRQPRGPPYAHGCRLSLQLGRTFPKEWCARHG